MDANMTTASDLFAKDLRHAVAVGAEHGIVLATSAVASHFGNQVYLVREHAP